MIHADFAHQLDRECYDALSLIWQEVARRSIDHTVRDASGQVVVRYCNPLCDYCVKAMMVREAEIRASMTDEGKAHLDRFLGQPTELLWERLCA